MKTNEVVPWTALHRHTLRAGLRGLLYFAVAVSAPLVTLLFGAPPWLPLVLAATAYVALLVPVTRMIGRAGVRDRAAITERFARAAASPARGEAIRRWFRP